MYSIVALSVLIAAAEAWQQGPPGFSGFHGQPPFSAPGFPWGQQNTVCSASTVTQTVTVVSPGSTLSTVRSGLSTSSPSRSASASSAVLASGSSSSSSVSRSSWASLSSSVSRSSSTSLSTSTSHSANSSSTTSSSRTITPAPSTSTFSEITASTAASTASGLNVPGNSGEHIVYSTVGGYFLQDLANTSVSTFDYIGTNFGLVNQTYPQDSSATANLSQWQRFNRVLYDLNQLAPANTVYKLLFIGRHGEGYHNAEQTYVGTPAWNCYYSEIDGNSTAEWDDAKLTPNGIAQAIGNANLWTRLFQQQGIEAPQSYYTSPLTRCLQTANYTYGGLSLPSYYPFVPTVKELLREGISIHTCDRRSNRTSIAKNWPTYYIDPTLTEYDELWNGITSETSSAQDYRSKVVLDQIFASDSASIISLTTHSGEGASLLRVLGHQPFSLSTGAIIPVLVAAKIVPGQASTTTTQPWQPMSWCTNGPPVTSQSDAPYACVCSGGVAPVATTAPASILFANP